MSLWLGLLRQGEIWLEEMKGTYVKHIRIAKEAIECNYDNGAVFCTVWYVEKNHKRAFLQRNGDSSHCHRRQKIKTVDVGVGPRAFQLP